MELLIFLYFFIALFFLYIMLNKVFISPVTIFIFSQTIFFLGLIQFLDYEKKEDLIIVVIYIIAILFFGLGSSVGMLLFPYKKNAISIVNTPLIGFQRQRITLVVAISFFLFLFFLYKTNFSTLRTMFGNLFLGQSSDITDARLQSYSVPGTAYIYMFRIVLLPTVVVAMFNKEYKYSKTVKIVSFLFMILFSLITGQRGGFAMIMIMWMLSYFIQIFYRKNRDVSKKLTKRVIWIFGVFLMVFSFMSIINGRVSNSVIDELFSRFLNDNQRTAYAGFHYIFEQDTSWGRNWYEEFINVLTPGDKYLPLSKVINSIIYGTTRGTAPPCLWGSVFYNFSWIGVVLFAFFYGILLHYVAYRCFRKEVGGIRCVLYSYMFVSLGMLVAGGPFTLVNTGFVPLIFLAFFLHVDKYSKNICVPKVSNNISR